MSFFSKFEKYYSNKVFQYLISRYATYFIQFINSIIIAVKLGPYYLGVWGFITMIIQYLNNFDLGISHSANVLVSINKNKMPYIQKVVGASTTMIAGLSLLVILAFVAMGVLGIDVGNKYNFYSYTYVVVIISVLSYFNALFSNVFRAFGRLFAIVFNQTLYPVLMLVVIIFFNNERLIWMLLIANAVAFFASFVLYIVKSPVKIKPIINRRLFKFIQKKGWYLFLYNTSFYFIILSTKSFISSFYTVKEFGYFTFAYTLSNVILLLMQSISFLIYPKLINRLATGSTQQIIELLNKLRVAYITTSHLLVHIILAASPLLLLIFPQYQESGRAFGIIALTLVLYTNSFGYSGFLTARGLEKQLGKVSLLTLGINIILTYILIVILKVNFAHAMIATMSSYTFFIFAITILGRKHLSLSLAPTAVIKDVFPVRLLIPYLISLLLILFYKLTFISLLPLVLFIALNFNSIFRLKGYIRDLLTHPNSIDI